MAVWSSNNIMLTQKGQELLSKVQAGVGQLTITKVVTGSGRVAASNLFTQTAVSSIKQTMSVTKVTTMSTGSNLELQVTNTNLSASYNIGARYFIRELLKPLPETARSLLEAKVPAAKRRTSCVYADFLVLYQEYRNTEAA